MKLWINRSAKLDSHFHKLTYTVLVKLCEWVILEYLGIIVSIEELTGIITRETKCHLCKVISTEAEEISFLSDLISCEAGTRNLHHSTNLVVKVCTSCLNLSICCLYYYLLNELKLFYFTCKRNHNLWNYLPVRMLLLYIDSCTDNSLCLHLSNLRIGNCKTKSSVSHHRVELVKSCDYILNSLNALALCICKLLNLLLCCRNELVKRWIKETDGNRCSL